MKNALMVVFAFAAVLAMPGGAQAENYQIKDGKIWRARDYFDMPGYLNMTKGDSNPWLLAVADTMHEQP